MSRDGTDEDLERGELLLERGRAAEAVPFLERSLAREPDDAHTLSLLAIAHDDLDGTRPRALELIERAIALEPDGASHHALRSVILARLGRATEGLAAADAAVRIDPAGVMGHTSRAGALLELERWGEAESAARAALSIDPDDANAGNLLAIALRAQGKSGENEQRIQQLLARDPHDPVTHANAGWTALRAGDRVAAETHFLEALRINPREEWARQGLIEAFKARSPLYRVHLHYTNAIGRFERRARVALLIGIFIGYRVLAGVLRQSLPAAATVLTVAYVLFALWTHLASGVGHFLIALDPRARHALRRDEILEGVVVGGGIFGGIVSMILAFIVAPDVLRALGFTLIGVAIPSAYAFTNATRSAIVFRAIAAFVLVVGLAAVAHAIAPGATPLSALARLAPVALFAVVLSTWLPMFTRATR